MGVGARTPNNLLKFITKIATRTRHMLLSTATPIQTSEYDLWDLLQALNQDAGFVLGTAFSPWQKPEDVLSLLKGEKQIVGLREGWQLLTNPLPPRSEEHTAELQSLMRISYAVFVLKKKT